MLLAAVFAGALTALNAEWSQVSNYSVTIEAQEYLGTRSLRQVLHYSYRRPDRARLEIVDGAERGGIVVWYGAERATAYKRGWSLFKLRLGPHDERVTSLRGNGILTPNFDTILACFTQHRSRVTETDGPLVDDAPTVAISLAYSGVHCPEDSAVDRNVTRDVLYVSRKTNLPVLRERYAEGELVERWELRDLRLNPGLADSAFR